MKNGITLSLILFYLTLVFILICALTACIARADEPLISFYQAPSDKNKTVIECSFVDGRKEQRLLIKNEDLDGKIVEQWVITWCYIK